MVGQLRADRSLTDRRFGTSIPFIRKERENAGDLTAEQITLQGASELPASGDLSGDHYGVAFVD